MRTEGRLHYGTIREIAEFLVSNIDGGAPNWKFQNCDFSVFNSFDTNKSLKDAMHETSGWYGIKHVDTGFDSSDLDLICDYYGGSCISSDSLYSGQDEEEMIKVIVNMITNTLSYQEGVKNEDIDNTYLIVEEVNKYDLQE